MSLGGVRHLRYSCLQSEWSFDNEAPISIVEINGRCDEIGHNLGHFIDISLHRGPLMGKYKMGSHFILNRGIHYPGIRECDIHWILF